MDRDRQPTDGRKNEGLRDRITVEPFVSVRSVRPLASSPRGPADLWDLPTGASTCPCQNGGGAYP
jgi:hypothetical protein